MLADGKKKLFLNEETVKAAKDLIVDRQAQSRESGEKVIQKGSSECFLSER